MSRLPCTIKPRLYLSVSGGVETHNAIISRRPGSAVGLERVTETWAIFKMWFESYREYKPVIGGHNTCFKFVNCPTVYKKKTNKTKTEYYKYVASDTTAKSEELSLIFVHQSSFGVLREAEVVHVKSFSFF